MVDERTPMGTVVHGGALALATILKVLAVLAVLGGVALAVVAADEAWLTGTARATYYGTVVGSTFTAAGLLAAAGYGLQVLVDCWEQLLHIRYSQPDE